MATRTKTDLDEEFKTETITLRGQTYVFREVSGQQYEECVRMAEGPDGTADLAAVLRLMIPLSLVSPKWDAEKIYNKPLPVVTAIQNLVNKLHFSAEKPDAEEVGAEPKNESEPETSSA